MASVTFALDIGTRSVVGTILQEIDGKHHVLDLISIEHAERAMIDGQIHNISDVATVIKKIKGQLEEKHGTLTKVSVAAAGRALVTKESMLTVNLEEEPITSTEEMHRLELAAVQQAQQKLVTKTKKNEDDFYYCVGYSVLHYTLDNQKIGSLIDQTGRTASIHVIATFLPQVVVESLLAALQHADLEMTALTLEPIAAIHVLVPPSMRKLNIALVDIGAGTSDIAIANENTITAYGMVPLAGDEVTDALSQAYLVDFPVAENIKRQLTDHETVEVEDILGFTEQIPTIDVCKQIDTTIEKIAQAIASEITRLNREQSPKAVILVGGGSLTPSLSAKISESLDLPATRVGIRGLEALTNVVVSESLGQSPELVTPIGIAIAAQHAPLHYMTVTLNGNNVRLFELNKVTVGDALIASNTGIDQLISRPGRGITITLNGETIAIPGEMGRSSTIQVNNEQVTIQHPIKNGDHIVIQGGQNGADAKPALYDVTTTTEPIQVTINNEQVLLEPSFYINGQQTHSNEVLQDRDQVEIAFDNTLEKVLSTLDMNWKENPFTLTLDGKPMRLKKWETQFYLGKTTVSPTHLLKNGDQLAVQPPKLPTLLEVSEELEIPFFQRMTILFNGETIQIEKPQYKVLQNGEITTPQSIIKQGDKIDLHSLGNRKIIFSDIFAFTNYELPKNVMGTYHLLRNEEKVELSDEIFQHDQLEIKFDATS